MSNNLTKAEITREAAKVIAIMDESPLVEVDKLAVLKVAAESYQAAINVHAFGIAMANAFKDMGK